MFSDHGFRWASVRNYAHRDRHFIAGVLGALGSVVVLAAVLASGCCSSFAHAQAQSVCVVSGTVVNGSAVPIANATVRFRTIQPTLVNGAGIAAQDLTTRTASDGTWSLTLIQGLNAQVDIVSVGIASDTVIPASTTAAFSSLTLYARGTLTPATILSDHGPSFGGDLIGSSPNPSVVGFRGKTLTAGTPTNGQCYVYSSGSTAFTLQSCVTGTAVASITAGQGITVGGSATVPIVGVTTAGITSALLGAGAASTNVGALGGDLTGTLPSPTIGAGKIVNAQVNSSAAIAWSKISKSGAVASDVGAIPVGGAVTSVSPGAAITVGGTSTVPVVGVTPAGITSTYLGSGAAATNVGTLGGDLSGTLPNPQIAAGTIVNADVNASAAIAWSKVSKSGAVASDVGAQPISARGQANGYAPLDGSSKVPLVNLPLTPPAAHASTHATVGSDPVSPVSIGAANLVHTHTESQVIGLVSDLAAKYDKSGGPVSGDVDASGNVTAGGNILANLNIALGKSFRQEDPATYSYFLGDLAIGKSTAPASALDVVGTVTATAFVGSFPAQTLLGDVTGNTGATVVSAVGGQSASAVSNAVDAALGATSGNTPDKIVKRNPSGNFSAGTITASLAGNATTASDGLTTASGSAPLTLTLAAKGLTGSVAGAAAGSRGVLRLAGDLGGTPDSPTVPGLASKANSALLITAGTPLRIDGGASADLSANRTLTLNTVPISVGGTGQITKTLGFQALSPISALGDLIYGDATGVPVRLGGTTSVNRKFLTETSPDGVATAAPAWNSIRAVDVPVMVASGASHSAGLVPDPGVTAGTSKFLREDATWQIPGSGGLGSVTSVTAGTGLTGTPNPITTTGTIALTAPVTPALGGTGTTTAFTQGSVVFAGVSGVYTQDTGRFVWDATNHRLGIGTSTPGPQLETTKEAYVASSLALPASGTKLFQVGSASNPPNATWRYGMVVADDLDPGAAGGYYGIWSAPNYSSSSGANFLVGLHAQATAQSDIAQLEGVAGVVQLTNSSGTATVSNNIRGGYLSASTSGAGAKTIATSYGLWVRQSYTGGTATITDNIGVKVDANAFTNAAISNQYGFNYIPPSNAACCTSQVAYYSGDLGNNPNHYQLYMIGANTQSHLEGKLGLGTGITVPTSQLEVKANASNITSAIFRAGIGTTVNPVEVYDGAAALRVFVDSSANLRAKSNIGAGNYTFTPVSAIHAVSEDNGSAAFPRGVLSDEYGNWTGALFLGRRASGTVGAPTISVSGDYGATFMSAMYDGSAYKTSGYAAFKADATVSAGVVPQGFELATGTNNTPAVAFTVSSAGQISGAKQHRGRVYNSAVQSVPDSAVTAMGFDSETYDVGALHDTAVNNSRFTIPSGTPSGLYRLTCQISWAANATGIRVIYIYKNGAYFALQTITPLSGGLATVQSITAETLGTAADYFQCVGFQASGGALNASAPDTTFTISRDW